tara:strand:- start:7067 stop:8815 length:1749 start_codon:yes stop_codon:yes gene_type:complete
MAQIPKETIDRVRDTADIVDVVSQYVDLKQRGPNYFGLCPFHQEKTPSFSVAPAKQIYFCFGCNSGGNVFSFLMDHLNIPFPDAVKILAERYNIEVIYKKGTNSSELFSSLYDLHEIATELYQENLFSKTGKHALRYLKERGITEDIIKQFKLGFAKDDWNQLVQHCKGKGFTRSQIIQSGLFTHSEKGIFDRFRSRIMFPIFHQSGKPIAFGGRIFQSNDPAKYLNSPETPLYKKSNIFYGLQATRDAIRKEGYVILVEGYMDFLKLYQSNIFPVVSVSGTAFSKQHANFLGKMAKKVVLLYDGDSAGGSAAIRAGWVLLKSALIPSIVKPPKQLDPDDWITKKGSSEVLTHIENPMSYIDFHLQFNNSVKLSGTDRQQYIIGLAKEIKNIEDGVIRNDLVKILSEKLSIDEKDFIRLINTQKINLEQNPNDNSEKNQSFPFTSRIDKAQIELIRILSNTDINLRKHMLKDVNLELFSNPLLNKLAKILIDEKLEVESSSIIEYFQDKNERDSIAQILFTKERVNSSEEIVSDCIKILKSEPIKEKISALRIKIREKELDGEDANDELIAITKLRIELNDL